MGSPVFVDTAYLVALLNRHDVLHDRAQALASAWAKRRTSLLTTDAVLIELANFFARSPLRSLTIQAIRQIRATPGWVIVAIAPDLIERAETRYAAHPDKGWSLTDCLGMEVMLKHNAVEVATPDHHFKQAGFKLLMAT
jgi:predicted nucleic acid-binding protein